jgi:hypothetical protein
MKNRTTSLILSVLLLAIAANFSYSAYHQSKFVTYREIGKTEIKEIEFDRQLAFGVSEYTGGPIWLNTYKSIDTVDGVLGINPNPAHPLVEISSKQSHASLIKSSTQIILLN